MKIKCKKTLNTTVDAIWEILRDPGNMPAWNHKCQTCSATSNVAIGSRFEATFQMSGKPARTWCEIIEFKPGEKITIRYSGQAFMSKNGFVDETFHMVGKSTMQSLIRHEVDVTNSELPVFVKFLMWFINTFGDSIGRSSLDEIEDLIKN